MKTKTQVLKDYIKFRRLRNKSRGINDIEFQIKKFLTSTKKPLKDFDEDTLLNYLDKITPKYTTSTLNTIKSSFLKNFIKWHFEDWSSRFRNLDSLLSTQETGEVYRPEEMLSEEEFKHLSKKEDSDFWKTYFMVLFYGGCRPSEVCNLKWKDVEFVVDGAFLTIYSKKNKRHFIKFVPSDVAYYLKKLKNESEFVFVSSQTQKPISVKTAYKRLINLSERVLGRRVNLYLLRHSIATIIYNKEGLKDDNVAKQMGHTKSMKGKYNHAKLEMLKANARGIYIEQDLPPERKHKLELEIAQLKRDQAWSLKLLEKIAQNPTPLNIRKIVSEEKKKLPPFSSSSSSTS